MNKQKLLFKLDLQLFADGGDKTDSEKIEELSSKVDSLTEELKSVKDENSSLKGEVDSLKEDNKKLGTELSDTKKSLEDTREAYKDMFGKGNEDGDKKKQTAPNDSKSPIDLVAECELK